MIDSRADISRELRQELNRVAGGSERIVEAGINRAFGMFNCDLTESEIKLSVIMARDEYKKEARLG